MARIEQVILTDDIDGGPAEETISFSIDGTAYEIDLSAHNAQVLRETLEEYTKAGTKLGKVQAGGKPARVGSEKPSGGKLSKEENTAIRDWANKQGLGVSERGRIPSKVVEAYQATVAA